MEIIIIFISLVAKAPTHVITKTQLNLNDGKKQKSVLILSKEIKTL